MSRYSRAFSHMLLAIVFSTFLNPATELRADIASSSVERKIALLIGNGAYNESPLKNPPNDAEDMAYALRRLGFTVTILINSDQIQMRKAIRQFGRELKKGGVGLFFYAGQNIHVHCF